MEKAEAIVTGNNHNLGCKTVRVPTGNQKDKFWFLVDDKRKLRFGQKVLIEFSTEEQFAHISN